MPNVRIDGKEYWAGRHSKLGVVVHAGRWQKGIPSDRVRLLVVSERRMGTFERGTVRRAMESQRFELLSSARDDIRRALRAMARNRPVSYRPSRALELLQTGTGIADATFRPGQEEAVRHVVEGRGRLLVVERTGWGKSFVYFIATRLLREGGRGPALLVSPLLSLMRNQIEAAVTDGCPCSDDHVGQQGRLAESGSGVGPRRSGHPPYRAGTIRQRAFSNQGPLGNRRPRLPPRDRRVSLHFRLGARFSAGLSESRAGGPKSPAQHATARYNRHRERSGDEGPAQRTRT